MLTKFSKAYFGSAVVFDRAVKLDQREWASINVSQSRLADYLKDEVAERVADRLLDIKKRFTHILDFGSGPGHLAKYIDTDMADKATLFDQSPSSLHRDSAELFRIPVERVVGDLEAKLPFDDASFDAVISSMSLHWVNDLPNAMREIHRVLKPEGLFLGAMLGNDTLYELRCSYQLAELERKGGLSPHVSPMTLPPDVSGLLNHAQFKLTTSTYHGLLLIHL